MSGIGRTAGVRLGRHGLLRHGNRCYWARAAAPFAGEWVSLVLPRRGADRVVVRTATKQVLRLDLVPEDLFVGKRQLDFLNAEREARVSNALHLIGDHRSDLGRQPGNRVNLLHRERSVPDEDEVIAAIERTLLSVDRLADQLRARRASSDMPTRSQPAPAPAQSHLPSLVLLFGAVAAMAIAARAAAHRLSGVAK